MALDAVEEDAVGVAVREFSQGGEGVRRSGEAGFR